MRLSQSQIERINRLWLMMSLDSKEWDESKHPRAANGQFGKGSNNQQETAEIGPFGKIYTNFRHDDKGAIKKLTTEKGGEAVAALSHPELGDIDLVWGEEGDPKNDYRGGYGLAKISKKHPEVLNDLQGILEQMTVDQERSGTHKARLKSADGKYRGVVRLTYENKEKKWLLTAFEKGVYVTSKTSDTANFSNVGDTALYIDNNAVDEIIDQHYRIYQQKIRINRLHSKIKGV
ncbi:hypothetical protein P2G70_10145 [Mannheimia haemolytica]|nr:hypothetical protein [Mannheimia haemolytica]